MRAALTAVLVVLCSGCHARSPFDEAGSATIRIARLASFERTADAPLPPPIARWLGDGTSGLPAELVPPGLLVGGTPLPRWDAGAPTFLGFHEVESRVTSNTLGREILGWAREEIGDGEGEGASCMYPELGLDIGRGGGTPSAKVLVSLACGQVRTFVTGEPPQDRGLGRRARAHLAELVARAFRSSPS